MARIRKRLGEMLVDAKLLNQEQLEKHLADQRKSGVKLGEYLISSGVFKEEQIVELISRQLKIATYNPEKYPVEPDVGGLIPADFSQKNSLVPLMRRHNLLCVAMTDPMDIATIDAVETMTNMEVETVICTAQDLAELIYSVYGVTSNLGSVMERMEEMAVDVAAGEDDEEEEAGDLNAGPSASLQDMAEEAPVIRLVNSILTQAVHERASDIHISPEKNFVHMRFRVDGKLKEEPAPPKSIFLPIISRLKILSGMDIAVSRVPQDGRFSIRVDGREIHLRASSLPTIHGENMVLRLLVKDDRIQGLEDLGLSETDVKQMRRIAKKPFGMMLATGPTGSGKSTTLYAMLRIINRPDVNVITLEDPVEYRVEKVRQVQLNRKAGMTFASGLRSILRQDPDVVMVGEIRDGETANIAVQAAMTGHLLLSTLHTNDSAGAVTRLVEMGVEPFLIASTLLSAVAQRLLRRVCPACATPFKPSQAAMRALNLDPKAELKFVKGKGCGKCHQTGFQGRLGIYEILFNDPMVSDMIMRRASSNEMTEALVKKGKLHTLQMDAVNKAIQGLTTLEEAASAVLL